MLSLNILHLKLLTLSLDFGDAHTLMPIKVHSYCWNDQCVDSGPA